MAPEKKTTLPIQASPLLSLWLPGEKICFQVTVEHELHDGVDWFVSGADPEQFDNVLVVKPFHHVSLAEEVDLLLDC